jgi:hypothetical protein
MKPLLRTSFKHRRLVGAAVVVALLALPGLLPASSTHAASAIPNRPLGGTGAVAYTVAAYRDSMWGSWINTWGDYTVLEDTPYTVTPNNPNAVVFVTQNLSISLGDCYAYCYDSHPLGVWYTGTNWAVFNEDGAPMPEGVAFNIYAVPGSWDDGVFVHQATTANSQYNYTEIDNPTTNNNPNAILIVTPNRNPGGNGGVYDPHYTGVWYDDTSGKWAIFNEDTSSAIPNGAAFNVMVLSSADSGAFIHHTSPSNTDPYGRCACTTELNNPVTNSNYKALVWVTPNYSAGLYGGYYYNDDPLAVYLCDGSNWCFVNQDGAAFLNGEGFNAFAVPDTMVPK